MPSDTKLLNVQEAASFLGVSPGTIRNWAQNNKLNAVKVGTRGDWRFTKNDLASLTKLSKKRIDGKLPKIKQYLLKHLEAIEDEAIQKHISYLGKQGLRKRVYESGKKRYLRVLKEIANHLEYAKLQDAVMRLRAYGTKFAKQAVKDGLTIQEAVDSTIFLKQVVWDKIKNEGFLRDLTSEELFQLNQTVGILIDTVSSQIAFVYHDTHSQILNKEKNIRAIAEKNAEESEQQYKTLFNSIDEGFCIVEMVFNKKNKPVDYIFLEVNKVFEKQTGLKKVIGKSVKELSPNLERHGFKIYENVAMTGKSVRFESKYDVMNRWFDVYASRIGGKDSKKVALVFKDITACKNVMDEMRESEERFRVMADAAPNFIWMLDPKGNSTYMNKEGLKFFGLNLDDFIKVGWSALIHPDDIEPAGKRLMEAIKNRSNYRFEHRIKRRDGVYRWVISRANPSTLSNGNLYGYIGTSIDITERKELDRQKDDFFGIASHELKTPVTSIKAFTQVLQNRFAQAGDEKSTVLLGKMDTQINKLASLIADLLDVTKIEGGKLQFNQDYFYFDELVDEIIEEVQRTTSTHTIRFKGYSKRTLFGDRERVGQVITNFLTNAIKYSPHADTIELTITSDNEWVTLCVKDFGMGIPKDNLPNIFERFYRVSAGRHNTVPGIGLGLYISSEIIKRQGGKIWAESVTGKGASFCFSLPIVKRNKKHE